jgi:hypothetical protein
VRAWLLHKGKLRLGDERAQTMHLSWSERISVSIF